MSWTVQDHAHANHNPVLTVNGRAGTEPIVMDVAVGEAVALDASQSMDPDGQALQHHWFHYAEAEFMETSLAAVTLSGAETAKAIVTATTTCRPGWLKENAGCPHNGTAHMILAGTEHGSPRLTSYRRII